MIHELSDELANKIYQDVRYLQSYHQFTWTEATRYAMRGNGLTVEQMAEIQSATVNTIRSFLKKLDSKLIEKTYLYTNLEELKLYQSN